MLRFSRLRVSQSVLRAAVAIAFVLPLTIITASHRATHADDRLGGVSHADDAAAYRTSVEKWRQDYEADLRSDHGWLTVSGLFWLHEGENKFGSDPTNDIVLPDAAPAEAGYFEFHAGKTTAHIKAGVAASMNGKPVETAELPPDSRTERLRLGNLTLWVHASGDRYAIRLRDPNSALRRDFHGLEWFPVDESYRVTARFVAYDKPKDVSIQNLAGDSLTLPINGYAAFTLQGQEFRLEAYFDPPENPTALSFVIRDLTGGKETYGAARFLDADPPKNGTVILDFNEAYNPPCAYNPYTTCPLPPPGNRMRTRIEAGEKAYHRDH
jgi:uncharacterized protein (DUF1684 family)